MKVQKNTHEALLCVSNHRELTPGLIRKSFREILLIDDDKIRTSVLSTIIGGLMARGPKKREVVSLVRTVMDCCDYKPFQYRIDDGKTTIAITGSGKKGHKTMNISSASALLAAGLGSRVVKPTSSATSSITGSSDFFEISGVNLNLPPDEATGVLKEVGVIPLRMEKRVVKFDEAYGGRFFTPNALSFGLPPMLCDIEYDFLLYGLAHQKIKLSAEVLSELGVKHALIYSSTDDGTHYIDEMGIYGTTRLIGIRAGKLGKLRFIDPTEMLGLPRYSAKDIAPKHTREKNVGAVLSVLAGKGNSGTRGVEDIVCINSANILYAAGTAKDLQEGFKTSKEGVRSGVGFEKLLELVDKSGGDITAPEKILRSVSK